MNIEHICKQIWRCISEQWLLPSKEWGAEIQIWWVLCADRWKMCTCQKCVFIRKN